MAGTLKEFRRLSTHPANAATAMVAPPVITTASSSAVHVERQALHHKLGRERARPRDGADQERGAGDEESNSSS
jgi:hypothetical protein